MKCIGKAVILEVTKVDNDNITDGGIFLPDDKNAEDELQFYVYQIGEDVTELNVGDIVLKPEVTVLRHTRTRAGAPEFDMRLPNGGDGIVVNEEDIRVVLEEATQVEEE